MAVHKGKQGTRGQKQILEENKETLKFYLYLTVGSAVLNAVVNMFVFANSFTTLYVILLLASTLTCFSGHQFMTFMAKAQFDPDGKLTDAGADLNVESGLAEHVKDLIILTSSCQVLSLISNYFWLLWLLAPGRAMHLLWANIIGPWIFQPAPTEEINEKKQRKMERKAKMAGMRR